MDIDHALDKTKVLLEAMSRPGSNSLNLATLFLLVHAARLDPVSHLTFNTYLHGKSALLCVVF